MPVLPSQKKVQGNPKTGSYRIIIFCTSIFYIVAQTQITLKPSEPV